MAKQITEEQIEKIVEKLVDRVEKANTIFLKNIGSSLKQLKKINPSKAYQLIQMLKYGTNYDDIIEELQKYTNLNVNQIDEIFKSYAKKDQTFYKQFYQYKDIPYIPFDNNFALKSQTMALANMVKNEMYNFTRQNILGYTINGEFHNLRDTYNQLLDEGFLQVGRGEITFDNAMSKILTDIGGSGLKTLDYETGRSIRLDSVVRMHLKSRLRELHNENQKIIGDEIKADGIEISVHLNPAEDHEEVQGRQFSLKEYEKLSNGLDAKDVNGHIYTLDHDGNGSYRPISEMNCYHYIFSIVLGVSKPEYTDKQLNEIRQNNNKGFELDGKHYTMYQGTQLQRSIERRIREQKDIQILAKSSGNDDLVYQSQQNITALTNKYRELSKVSGLPVKTDRLKISGYRRMAINKPKVPINRTLEEWNIYFKDKYGTSDFIETGEYENKLFIGKNLDKVDTKFLNDSLNQVDYLYKKYHLENKGLRLLLDENEDRGIALTKRNNIAFTKDVLDIDKLHKKLENYIDTKWLVPIDKKYMMVYPITHEFGHVIENEIIDKLNVSKTFGELKTIDSQIKDEILSNVMKRTDLSKLEIKQLYFSDYANSEPYREWFAESFTQLELGKKNIWIEEFEKWLKEHY